MNPGDVIKFRRPGYVHYAIFIGMEAVAGENSVIHWWKDVSMPEPSVLITPYQTLADNMMHETVPTKNEGIDLTLVVSRSLAFKKRLDALKTDTENFNGLFDNSHHFINWCRRGLWLITEEDITEMKDPWRFVHGSVTNTAPRSDTSIVLHNLHPGDIIRFFHRDYEHWALYLENGGGVPRVIHWWDRDSVEPPSIAIHELRQIVGCCESEIVKYEGRNANGQRAAVNAEMFINIARRFPNIADRFHDSKQFAFWCCFGLGSNDLPEMNTVEDVNNFVTELMDDSDPDFIRRDHNSAIQNMLNLGDLIRFSKDSQEFFGLYIGREQDIARVMCWMEKGPPTIMVVPFSALSENMKVTIEYDQNLLRGVINWNEMVNRANALRTNVRNTRDDCNGLFTNSKHFATWIFDNYGRKYASITPEKIEEVEDIWQHIYNFKKSNKSLTDKAEIRWKNKMVLDTVKEGDLVKFHRTILSYPYDHYAVYIANSEHTGAASVIHWSNGDESYIWLKHLRGAVTGAKASLRTDSFWTVAGYEVAANGNDIELEVSYIDGQEVVKYAKTSEKNFNQQEEKERKKYHLLTKNCEHFATNCRYGNEISKQVYNFPASVVTRIFSYFRRT